MKEDDKGKTSSGISRRQFLGAGAAVAGGVIVVDQLFPRELRAIGVSNLSVHGIRKQRWWWSVAAMSGWRQP